MKACPVCGSKYTDHVSYCFADGAVLSVDRPPATPLDAPPLPGAARRTRGRSLIGNKGGHGLELAPLGSALDAPPLPGELDETDAPAPQGLAPAGVAALVVKGNDFLRPQLALMTVLPRERRQKEAPAAPPTAPAGPPAAPAAAPPVAPPAAPNAAASSGAPPQAQTTPNTPQATPAAAGNAPVAATPPDGQPGANANFGASPGPDRFEADFADDEPVAVASRPVWILPLVAGIGVLGLAAVALLGVGILGVSSTHPGDQPPAAPTAPAADVKPPEAPVEAPPEAVEAPPEPVEAPPEAVEAPPEPVEPPPEPTGPPVAVPTPPTVGTPKPPVEAPAARVGTVLVNTTPPGARVNVGGRQGVSPFTAELPLGGHDLKASLDGYEAAERRVDVVAGQQSVALTLKKVAAVVQVPAPKDPEPEVPAAPAARTGAVMVFSAGRDGDELWIDGKPAGKLPGRVQLPEGRHTFKVVGAKGEFESTKDVAFNAAGTAVVTLAQ